MAPARLGPYQVLGAIGRGAMGAVYRARSPEGRVVAVKVLLDLSPARRARFQRERRLLESIGEAEGFVPLLDAGDSDHGPYIVMPFIGGGTLRDRLERGPLGIEETVRLGRELARALAKAHERGIVHRDLKPENILYSDSGRALVADLGLGKHFEDSLGASVSMSATGTWRGTPGYMAPEQMKNAKTVGPQADVFSLGAILYECLAGVRAYPADTLIEMLGKVETGTREPLAKARPGLPSDLVATIDRTLAPDPARRFRDALELARALDPPAVDAKAAAPRRKAVAALLALGVLLAVAFLAMALAWRRSLSVTPAQPTLPRQGAPAPPPPPPPPPPPRLDPVVEAESFLQRARDERDEGKLAEATEHCRRSLELDPRSGQAWHLSGLLKGDLGDDRAAIADFTRALECTRSPTSYWARAYAYAKLGDKEEALDDYARALRLDPKDKSLWRNRGTLLYDMGRLDAALEHLDTAIDLDRRYADAWSVRGLVHQKLGLLEKALADDERALALDPTAKNADSIRTSITQVKQLRSRSLIEEGKAAEAQGQPDLAIGLYTKAIAFEPTLASSWIHRGLVRLHRNDDDGAIEDFTKATEVDPKVGEGWFDRGVVRKKKNDVDGAVADYTKAIEVAPKLSGPVFNRGLIRHERNDLEGALADFTHYLEIGNNEGLRVAARDKIAAITSKLSTGK